MIAAMNALEVISLFVEDLPATDAFYRKVFAHEIIHGDDVCSIMKIGNIVINLLRIENAPTLVEPGKVAGPAAGARALYTVNVKDADAAADSCATRSKMRFNMPPTVIAPDARGRRGRHSNLLAASSVINLRSAKESVFSS
jgi:predicted enzyme related to lactoylglutathione lyase